MEEQEYRPDDQALEIRRLKRLHQKKKRKTQQRILLGVLALLLILGAVLLLRGCRKEPVEEEADPVDPGEQEVSVEPDTVVTMAAVGDIMFYQDQLDAARGWSGVYDFTGCFSAVSPYTLAADLTVGNLELNFCGKPYSGYPEFRAPDDLAAHLAGIGFDILQTANTYSITNGLAGLNSTIQCLDAAGLEHVGTYASAEEANTNGGVLIRDIKGIRIAFLAYTKGLNGFSLPEGSEYAVNLLYTDYDSEYSEIDRDSILKSISAAKAQSPDIIIAMLHWGSEFDAEITDSQKQIQKLMLENGVDVILGSHSHIAGPMEEVPVTTVDGEQKTCFVAYSLGNFVASQSQENTKPSVLLNLEITKSGKTGTTSITDIGYIPLYMATTLDEEESPVFQVLPIRTAVSSGLFPELDQVMTDALSELRTSTDSDYDSGK